MKVTIITVVLNGERDIEKTIKSVISQDYSNVEYIIIDGGSTDRTIDIIKKYEDKVDFWCSEKDQGIYDAMNKGIDKATGDLVNFMNAGDVYKDPFALSHLLEDICAVDYGLIFANFISSGITKSNFNKEEVYSKNKINSFFCHQSTLFNRRLLGSQAIKYDIKYKIKSDRDLVARLLYQKNVKFIVVDMVFCIYNSNGVSSIDIVKKEMENIEVSKNISWICFIKTACYSIGVMFIFIIITKVLRKNWQTSKCFLKSFFHKLL